ncbi:MAG: phenylalanine--tRNA ligase subunit beta [Bacteroidales bacterium]|nr:phenylalanine--tRNA ligase subunit beta [Bacteroidales bacterium]
MKLSYNWLKQYVDLDVDPQLLSTILTDIGLEVESMEEVQSIKGGLQGVVTGTVLTCERHANADKLSVTTVDVGNGKILPIVCGAPNVAKGQKVLVATVGTTLYDGDNSMEIKKAKIRGEVSEGMICAEDELGLGSSHDGIMVLPESVVPGIPAADYFDLKSDYVYEIGLTPNRSDAASHMGAARDLVAGLNRYFKTRKYQLKRPDVSNFSIDNHDLDIDIEVRDLDACPRYSGITLKDIQVKESPVWLKKMLMSIGLRPINNVVDITNFVLYETGHPLHAFDAAKIKGNKVVVQKQPADTPFVTLDNEERKLHPEDLMICNVEEGMCIAGVFGGAESGVTEKTTSVFIESAYFDPRHVRKTSKRHTLQTDASFRFERGADPNITIYALKRAALLMKELAGGTISSEIKDVYPEPIKKKEVDIDYANVDRLVGMKIDREIIKEILTDMEMGILEETANGLKLEIPTFKVDVLREVDVVEEILRVFGYNNVSFEDKIHSSVSLRKKPDAEKIQNAVSDYLMAQGFFEMMNNSLTKSEYFERSKVYDEKNNVVLLNPLSRDLNVMRQTLLYGGLEVIAYNQNRKLHDLKIFEFGKTYFKKENYDKARGQKNYKEERHLLIMATGQVQEENWNSQSTKVNFYYLRGLVDGLIQLSGIDADRLESDELNDGNFQYGIQLKSNGTALAEIGLLNKELLKYMGLKSEVFAADIDWDEWFRLIPREVIQYKPVAKFPEVRRDLALVVDKNIRFQELKSLAFKMERKLLKSVGIFDVYEGDKIPEGKKSYALSFILQDESKTLTDKLIDKTMQRIQQAFEKEIGASLR